MKLRKDLLGRNQGDPTGVKLGLPARVKRLGRRVLARRVSASSARSSIDRRSAWAVSDCSAVSMGVSAG